MKKTSISVRILLPTAIIMLLFPMLSCFIFYAAAMRYSYQQAERELESVNENVLDAMERKLTFEAFLNQIVLMASGNSGNARLIVFSGEKHVVYPRDTVNQMESQNLAEEFLSAFETVGTGEIKEWKAVDGKKYLVSIHFARHTSKRFGGVIVYCPAENIGSWVKWAAMAVFLLSVLAAGIVLLVLFLSCRSITVPLKKLCMESRRIGYGNFQKIESTFSLKEPEMLRLSMNRMTEQLEKSDGMQKLFFQNASHELRNPLMSISGYAQGIEQGVFPDSGAAAHTILEESTRLTEIVESLLTLSRLDTKNVTPVTAKVDAKRVIEGCLDRVYGLAMKKDVCLSFEENIPDAEAFCDEELLEKVIDNILSNAVRYAKSSVIVSVSKSADSLDIHITDDGDGISEEDFPHIFERCYKGKGGNHGIGLAIAESAARLMNAGLVAENMPQGGARFTIKLQNSPSLSD